MNARIPVLTRALPPLGAGEQHFSCILDGVLLDCAISTCEDCGIEVRAVWHAGVNIGELLAQHLDVRIEVEFEHHGEEVHTDVLIERAAGVAAACAEGM